MTEEIIPDTLEVADVAESVEPAVNYSEKTLAELVRLFEELAAAEDKMKRNKDAEAIKAAFYRRLSKERAEAGITVTAEVPGEPELEEEVSEDAAAVAEPVEVQAVAETVSEDPFTELERGFKSIYTTYKKERAEYNRQGEQPCPQAGGHRRLEGSA